MELWIRSQDKTTLIRSYEIYIAGYGKDSYVIRAKRTSHILGAYNSFERALEILNEIHQRLIDLQTLDINSNNSYADFSYLNGRSIDCVYVMPKD